MDQKQVTRRCPAGCGEMKQQPGLWALAGMHEVGGRLELDGRGWAISVYECPRCGLNALYENGIPPAPARGGPSMPAGAGQEIRWKSSGLLGYRHEA